MGGARGEFGVKLGRCRGGGVDAAFLNHDAARHHFDGIGKMEAQRFKLDQFRSAKLYQRRCVAPGLDFRPRGFHHLLSAAAGDERRRNQERCGK